MYVALKLEDYKQMRRRQIRLPDRAEGGGPLRLMDERNSIT